MSFAAVGYLALLSLARQSNGVSAEADLVQSAATEIVEHAENSQALFQSKADALTELSAIAEESLAAFVNANEGNPVTPAAYEIAEDFLRAMPDDLPLPEVAVEPDGSISFDWIENRMRMFSVVVGDTGRLAYAWLDGTDRGHAVAAFNGIEIPPRILEGIQSIMRHADAPVGVA